MNVYVRSCRSVSHYSWCREKNVRVHEGLMLAVEENSRGSEYSTFLVLCVEAGSGADGEQGD